MAEDLAAFKAKKDHEPEAIQEFMKTLLRTGFELVMERLGKYTPDLYFCYEAFAQYYPQYESLMRKALYFYLYPDVDKADLALIIDALGPFLVKEVERRP